MPFDLGIPISKNCKICQVFLFLRPARSFSDQALGSPQASIPALTAVWIHGGEHWDLVEGAHGTSLDLKNMKAGEYIYRLVASDMYSNTAHQDFYVTVKGNGIADSVAEAVSNAVKTGDSLPIAGVAGIAVVAAGAAGVAAKKRREGKEDAQ